MKRLLAPGLALAATMAVGVAAPPAQSIATETAPAAGSTTARWPGHQPGKVVLGMSCGSACGQRATELGGPYGVHRQFLRWADWQGVAHDIQEDHAADRLPWVSVKPPSSGAAGWREVAEGRHDAAIRSLASTLKANDDKPVLITFHHEPSNDGTEAEGALWASAYAHFHDVLKAEGALENVADPPILGDWLFNDRNRAQDPANWVQNKVLRRAPFLGIDLYENNSGETFAQRLPRILDWMADRGFPNKMVGIGEAGATDRRYDKTGAVAWIQESLTWATNHPDKVGVVSFFNSTANSRDGVYWPLDESASKLETFRTWLKSSAVAAALAAPAPVPAPVKPTTTTTRKARWPGHRPGKVVLGMSCGSVCQTREQQLRQEYGVHRQFRSWGNWRGVAKDIREDQAHGRLPWISVKGPNGGPSGWRAVASGRRDGAIRALARTLKAHDDKPVLITFHHEPSNDGTEAQGRLWARAYNRFHDVLKARGALRNVADPPILGEWLFNQRNKRQNPANWVTRGVLKRAPFLGVDLYENNSGETFAQRLPRVLRWMARRGFPHKMVGVGESAATSKRYAAKSAVGWINESLNWARRHPNRIGVVSYFNSTHNSRAKVYWPLDESPRKLRTFRRWLSDRVMVS